MNSLFPIENPFNLLPFDGTARYFGVVFSQEESQRFYHILLNDIVWKNDEAVIYGKRLVTKRKVAWYADEPYSYTYSGVSRTALAWNKPLMELKQHIELLTGERFNSCLLNLYHNGSEGMAWHSDGERELRKHGTIASVSFGAERKFAFKHKTRNEKREVFLEHGSLITMENETQDFWLHRLPPTTKVHSPRINLTFRQMNN